MEVDVYIRHRAEIRDVIFEKRKRQKEASAVRYNRGTKRTVHGIGSYVMLYQKNAGKVMPRWRGPFIVAEYSSERQLSYRLRQLNGRRIRGKFHGDHLKTFVPRSVYLADSTRPTRVPQQQTYTLLESLLSL